MQDLEIGDGPYHENPFRKLNQPLTYEEMDAAGFQRQADPESGEPVNEAIREAREEASRHVEASLA